MISFVKVDLTYKNRKIFKKLSFQVQKGEKVVVSGKSGSGKTSLFNLLLGFSSPDSGDIVFERLDVNEKNVWEVRKKIAYVDQDVSLPDETAINWVNRVMSYKANSIVAEYEKRLNELLEYFEISKDDLDKNIDDLSGGERQRIAIIASILLSRNVFFLDEITSALDKPLKEKTADLFLKEKGWTVIIISHDPVWLNRSEVKVFDLERKEWKQ